MITNQDKLKGVPEFHPYSKMLPGAALAILVVADPARVKYEGELRQLWIQDCSFEIEKNPVKDFFKGLLYFLKNRNNHRTPLGLIIKIFAHSIPNAIL